MWHLLCITKLSDRVVLVLFKIMSFTLGLLDQLLQQINVIGESLFPRRRQGAGRQWSIVLEGFRYRNISGLLQCANVSGQISIRHAEGLPHFGERQLGRGGQHGHNGEPAFLVDDPVELEKGLWIHTWSLRGSVK